MATETLRPNGDSSVAWPSTGGSGATHAVRVADASDTTYVRNNTGTDQTDLFDLGNTALTTETITSIDLRFRARSETAATGHIQIGVRLSGTDSLAADETSISTTASNFTKTSISRPGGGSWAVSDLNALQCKIIGNGGANAIRCFDIYVDVNYTVGGSSIKTVNGLAKASVKTVNGLAIASVKSINGLQ